MMHVSTELNNLPSDSNDFTMLLKKQMKVRASLKWMQNNTSHGYT